MRPIKSVSIDISTDEHIKLGERILVSVVEQYACDYWAKLDGADDGEHGYSIVYMRVGSKQGDVTAQSIIEACKRALLDVNMRNEYVLNAAAMALFRPADCDYDNTVADVLTQYALLGEIVYG